ncbi:MAG: hypothetical protein RQ875_06450 [Vicingaceae bacterium]|nr:hypothetical protein [Vicingaceae bacterium]
MKHFIYIILIILLNACNYNSIDLSEATQPTGSNVLTYNKDVKRIFDTKCVNCHSANATQLIQTPFYTSYNKVKNGISGIQTRALILMDMPSINSINGALTQGEKDTLQLWINQGALE